MTAHDNWPRTYRLLPWLLAAFVCMIWLVPTEGVELSVPLPVDPTPDRFLLGAIVLLWLASLWARRALVPSTAAQAFSWTLLIFVTVALVSVALNAETLAGVGELEQATKKLVVLVGYALLFFVVATVVRPGELKNFGIFMVGLAAIVAVGAIYEYRVDYNVFYDLAKKLFSGIASVAPTPNEDGYGRRDTFGATTHGLALTTMLAMVLPFAVLGLSAAGTRARKAMYAVAVTLILAAGLATLRKTSIIAPVVVLTVLLVYRPREMLRMAPFGVVALMAIHVMAPAALGSVWGQFTGGFFDTGTTQGRTSDYESIAPDVAANPLIGRGYGTIDPERSDTYRILDNEYLGQVIQVGFLGLVVYLALIVVSLTVAHRVIRRSGDRELARLAVAAAAAFAAFGVASTLFDILSFPQVPYLFLFIAGLCSVAAHRSSEAGQPAAPGRRPLALPGARPSSAEEPA